MQMCKEIASVLGRQMWPWVSCKHYCDPTISQLCNQRPDAPVPASGPDHIAAAGTLAQRGKYFFFTSD
jgi:hypothetical protein